MDQEYEAFLGDVRRHVTTHMPSFQKRAFLNLVGGMPALRRPDFMNRRALDYLEKHSPEVLDLHHSSDNGRTSRFSRRPDVRHQTMSFGWTVTRNADGKLLAEGRGTDRTKCAETLSQARDLYRAKPRERLGEERAPPGITWFAMRDKARTKQRSDRTRPLQELVPLARANAPKDRARSGWDVAAKQSEQTLSSPELDAFRRAIAPANGRGSPGPERTQKQRKPFRPAQRQARLAAFDRIPPDKKLPLIQMGGYEYQIGKFEHRGRQMARYEVWKAGPEPREDRHLAGGNAHSVAEAEREAQRSIRKFERGDLDREEGVRDRKPFRPKHQTRSPGKSRDRGRGDEFGL